MGKASKKTMLIISIVLFAAAFCILLYPTVSNLFYQVKNQTSIAEYSDSTSSLSKTEKEKYLDEARAYNKSLTETVTDAFSYSYENIKPDYETVLNFNDGQICQIKIPKIGVNLPVYHGTSEKVLIKGAAHSANTSFPIGGIDTHAVISAHTAFPGKVFFDKLTELKKGDMFYISIIDETLSYKIRDINIVNPDDTSKLQIAYGKDLVSLVTCYPYAVNSHRLIVTGERTENANANTQETVAKSENTLFYIAITIFILILITAFAVFKILTEKIKWNKI